MFEVGTVCIKTAGRDAGKSCVVVEAPHDSIVVVEGETRRRKCNIRHLEPTTKTVSVKAGASHDDVMKALGLSAREKKPRKPTSKPSVKRTVKPTAAKPKAAKKTK